MAEGHHKGALNQVENTLDLYFHKKAPALPQNVKEILVKLAPFLAIISVVVTVPGLLVLVGLGGVVSVISPLGGYETMSEVPTMWLSILFLIPVVILEALAIPGLFARKAMAWRYMYWAQLISIVSGLIQFNILGTIISAIISFYILFQIKSFYK